VILTCRQNRISDMVRVSSEIAFNMPVPPEPI
jgi:hypothetical protein